MVLDEFYKTMEGAKQQRAEKIGSGLQSRPLLIAVIAVISLAFVQFAADPISEHAGEVRIAGFAS